MKAAVRDEYGGPDRVRVRDVAMPDLTPAGALVRVRAASLNRIDWYELTGSILISRKQMGMRRPTLPRLGFDFAGVVEAAGAEVSGIAVGDEVYGVARGSLAEYVVAEKAVIKPAGLSFEEAATAPLAGVTALQAVRDKAGVAPGHRVLVNGASGGVGRSRSRSPRRSAPPTSSRCSRRHHDAMRRLGADEVIDYVGGEFAALPEHSSQVAIQVNGSRSWSSYRRVLQAGGTLVIVGGPAKNRLVGPLGQRRADAPLVPHRVGVAWCSSSRRRLATTLTLSVRCSSRGRSCPSSTASTTSPPPPPRSSTSAAGT
jgi:NADPH:quinone reductase-like Zn-dependent oxidoreductase